MAFAALNHAALSQQYTAPPSSITGWLALVAYCMLVPWMGAKVGVPANFTSHCAVVRFSTTVCTSPLFTTASLAALVPGTLAITDESLPPSDFSCANSGGNWLTGTKVHGPLVALLLNQRPDASTQ